MRPRAGSALDEESFQHPWYTGALFVTGGRDRDDPAVPGGALSTGDTAMMGELRTNLYVEDGYAQLITGAFVTRRVIRITAPLPLLLDGVTV